MYKNHLAVAVVSLLALNTALATNHQENEKKRIDVNIESDRTVRITNASAVQESGAITVSGVLRPKTWTARTAGHVHISLIGENGAVVKTFIIEPNKKVFMRKSSRRPKFRLSIPEVDSAISKIILKHHKAPLKTCS